MIGAIIGDVIGSSFEFWPPSNKDFPLWNKSTSYTDDSVMTIAIGRAVLRHRKSKDDFRTACIEEMQKLGRKYPRAGYGHGFRVWLESEIPEPYNSFGNGSAMRVSACGYAACSLDEALSLSQTSAEVSHNHPEGIKGAQATAAAIYLARTGASKEEIGGYICDYFYLLNKTLDEIRLDYHFNETCQDTVPQAIVCFLESESYEDAIRNAVSLGGDADTLGAITGAIAWAYYGRDGIQEDMSTLANTVCKQYLPREFINTLDEFATLIGDKIAVDTCESKENDFKILI